MDRWIVLVVRFKGSLSLLILRTRIKQIGNNNLGGL
jgi:hypothetical protein